MKKYGRQSALLIKARDRGRKRYWEFYDEDEHACQSCGKDVPLEIHHKDGDPLNNELVNLVALCRSCHRTVEKYKKNGTVRSQLEAEFDAITA
jgi:5-methylcytosine-specific restriction endonuclease McrA